jgi:hypothetical protein
MSSYPSSPPPVQNTVVRKIVLDNGRMYTTFSINLGLLILGGLYYLYNAKSGGVADGQEEEEAVAAAPISARARAEANAAGPPGP